MANNPLTRLLKKLPMPKVHHTILALAIIYSILAVCVYHKSYFMFLILLVMVLLFDILDMTVTLKYELHSDSRHIRDMMADRLSEGIIFVLFFNPWFYLFVLNCFLTLYSYKNKKYWVMPLRYIFLLFLIVVWGYNKIF